MARFLRSATSYAGKKGPCPKCKKEIVVPDKSQKLSSMLRNIGPQELERGIGAQAASASRVSGGLEDDIGGDHRALAVIGVAIYVRLNGMSPPAWLLALGALGVALPLVMLAYTFLRNDELEGYSGREYWLRSVICAAVFALTWLLYYGSHAI